MPRPILLLAALLPAVLSCSERTAEPPVVRPAAVRIQVGDDEAGAARALLARASPSLAAGAFRRLEARAYTVDVLVHEIDYEGGVIGRRRRTIERAPDSIRESDQTLLGEVLASQGGSFALLRHVDPVAILLPESPPYLEPGTREYEFRLLPDRILDGRRLSGAQAARRPGVEEPIRLVRSWVDAQTGEPVALELERASSSMLLTEEARLDLMLGPTADDELLPRRARIDVSVKLLSEGPRRFVIDMALEGAANGAP